MTTISADFIGPRHGNTVTVMNVDASNYTFTELIHSIAGPLSDPSTVTSTLHYYLNGDQVTISVDAVPSFVGNNTVIAYTDMPMMLPYAASKVVWPLSGVINLDTATSLDCFVLLDQWDGLVVRYNYENFFADTVHYSIPAFTVRYKTAAI